MPHEAIAQFEALASERYTWEEMWQAIADNMIGRRDFNTIRTPGERRMSQIYDTTGLLSAELLAGALHALMTNTATKWFRLNIEDRFLNEDPDVRFWIDEIAEPRMYNAINRPSANFNPQMHEVYFDLTAFCTASCFVEDEPGFGAVFSARPMGETYIAEDSAGRIDTIYRKIRRTARQCVQDFGARAPMSARKAVSDNKPEELVVILHAIRPRHDPVPGRLDRSGMPWESLYFDLKEKTLIEQGGYFELPMMVPRWSKDSGERYGRGPGVTALPDVQMLNAIWKTVIKGAQKMVDPPLLMDNDGVITQLNTSPGSVNIQEATSVRENSVRPLLTAGRPDLGADLITRKQQNVQSAFHAEVLPLFNSPYMTATQVLELVQQAQRFLSPILGRLQSELLEPMIERVFGIELRAGRMGPIPEILANQNIRVEYISPIARAQKASDVQAIIDTFTVAGELEQIYPGVSINLDADEALREIAEAKGIPIRLVRDAQVVAQMRQQQQQLAQQQQQQEQLLAGADAAAKLIPALSSAQAAA